MAKLGIGQIMAQWKGGKTPTAVAGPRQPKGIGGAMTKGTPKAALPPMPAIPKARPGLTATRNNLANMRKDTLPKGFK